MRRSTSATLIDFHNEHGKKATITAVAPPGRFGALEFEGDLVRSFSEKPAGDGGLINGGFFVARPVGARPHRRAGHGLGAASRSSAWPSDGELVAYRHDGFWQPMDTLRDKIYLEELWQDGAPWKCW